MSKLISINVHGYSEVYKLDLDGRVYYPELKKNKWQWQETVICPKRLGTCLLQEEVCPSAQSAVKLKEYLREFDLN